MLEHKRASENKLLGAVPVLIGLSPFAPAFGAVFVGWCFLAIVPLINPFRASHSPANETHRQIVSGAGAEIGIFFACVPTIRSERWKPIVPLLSRI
jgi:hypothetical protein